MKLAIFEPDQRTLSSLDQEKYKILKDIYLNDKSSTNSTFTLTATQQDLIEIHDQYIFLPLKLTSFVLVEKILKTIPTKSSIIFHLDGEFVFQCKEWMSLLKTLKGRNIKFVTSSMSHQKLVQSLLGDNNKVFHLPVSIQPLIETNSEIIRKFRTDLNVLEEDFVFLYNGPITRQSNILELTRMIIKLRSQLHLKIHLWIYGEFDDIAMPLIGKTQLNFEYYQQWKMMVDTFEAHDYIKYLGEAEELDEKGIIAASDWGIYPTAIDSQDFNFSALKFLSHGLPTILSDWGSHFEFISHDYIKRVSLVNDSPFHQVDINDCAKTIIKIVQNNDKKTKSQRDSLTQDILAKFSSDQNLQVIGQIFSARESFLGFSDLFLKAEKAFEFNPYAPFVDVSSFGSYNSNFKIIYESYINNS